MKEIINETRNEILKSAKKEFLRHGFTGASLRTIASGAGLTTGALYRHFSDKADLFDAIVSPCFKEFVNMYEIAASDFMAQLDEKGMEWSASEEGLVSWTVYIYDNLEVFKLLLLGAEKTAYEHFTHILIDMEVKTTIEYMKAAKEKGYSIREVSSQELHMLVNAQFSTLFEMVIHDVPREQAMVYIKTVYEFFAAGWRTILVK